MHSTSSLALLVGSVSLATASSFVTGVRPTIATGHGPVMITDRPTPEEQAVAKRGVLNKIFGCTQASWCIGEVEPGEVPVAKAKRTDVPEAPVSDFELSLGPSITIDWKRTALPEPEPKEESIPARQPAVTEGPSVTRYDDARAMYKRGILSDIFLCTMSTHCPGELDPGEVPTAKRTAIPGEEENVNAINPEHAGHVILPERRGMPLETVDIGPITANTRPTAIPASAPHAKRICLDDGTGHCAPVETSRGGMEPMRKRNDADEVVESFANGANNQLNHKFGVPQPQQAKRSNSLEFATGPKPDDGSWTAEKRGDILSLIHI